MNISATPTVSPGNAKSNISVVIENGTVRVRGISPLIEAGCVPYIFRHTKKRNQYHHRKEYDEDPNKKYCSKRKGWNLWGSRNAVKVVNGIVYFSINPKTELTNDAVGWATTPTTVVKVYKNRLGLDCIGWARSIISLHDAKDGNKHRMIRLRFAIAFGPILGHGRVRVTPDNMVSNLAEFSVVYNPSKQTWSFSR